MMLLAASAMLIPSCKKDSKDTTPAPVNVLCDGNGSSSYFPMVLNDSWTYSYTISIQTQNVHPKLVVSGTASHNSKTYFTINDQTSAMYTNTLAFREDATTHNIYYYDSNSSSEFMYIPASPTLNQTWAFSYSGTRKATNLSASVTTAGCTYSGLLEISEYNSSGTLQKKEYFKKGIGMVHRQDPDSFFGGYDKFSLTAITLN